PELLSRAVFSLNFPKTMRWGTTNHSFARPVRWLLALYGDQVIDFELAGLKTDRITYGIRFLSLDTGIILNNASEYMEKLQNNNVIPSRSLRKKLIEKQIINLMKDKSDKVVNDPAILDEVTDLVEYPTAVLAEFPGQYLELPDKIIISTLTQHQKYFAVRNDQGQLTNKFVFISNGDVSSAELIRFGNEKVVKARLEDAQFYYREDTGRPLEDYINKLEEVTFQEKLGTLKKKTERITQLAEYIISKLELTAEVKENTLRAARLCKADLVTLMLGEKEFTKLQGYIGQQYALRSGENEIVAQAIYEHYQPRGQLDDLPGSLPGAIVALADKLDTVCGIISVDLLPTGSNDPFALRRAANGIVQIIAFHRLDLNLFELIEKELSLLAGDIAEPLRNREFLIDFFKQRVNWLLQEEGIDYDVIDSVMHIDCSRINDLLHRAKALQEFKQHENFIKLVIGFKRVSNIITTFNTDQLPDSDRFLHQTEFLLLNEAQVAAVEIEAKLIEKDYPAVLSRLVAMGHIIDQFFDDVLVNVDDPAIRENRYRLLNRIRILFLKVADIAKIVVEGNQ
ncbi:MAG: glycine--tRNA ligase subunit beta, partial [Candidatus Cloacimonetes bacterium]|nr:glycine--tRNA ligase subunit beta [Candidatus Cloacimonadota bacterium]